MKDFLKDVFNTIIIVTAISIVSYVLCTVIIFLNSL